MTAELTNDENCIHCHGQPVESMASGERIACRVCLGTGRGPHPYGNDLGHEARLRELRRIGELVEQRDLVLSAWELMRPWFEGAVAEVEDLKNLAAVRLAQDASAAVLAMLEREVEVR